MEVIPAGTLGEVLSQQTGVRRSAGKESGSFSAVLTASLGVASLNPGRVVDVKRLVGAADRALYLAKQGGRDRVEAAA
jgi:PleD family two-component response regulator